jgi:hypothetical protein
MMIFISIFVCPWTNVRHRSRHHELRLRLCRACSDGLTDSTRGLQKNWTYGFWAVGYGWCHGFRIDLQRNVCMVQCHDADTARSLAGTGTRSTGNITVSVEHPVNALLLVVWRRMCLLFAPVYR